jgi:hypothetical protein
MRLDQVFSNALQTQDMVLPQEFMKGEGAGIFLSLNFINLLITALEEEIESRKSEETEEDA